MTGTLQSVDGRFILRFERRLAHPADRVWQALTEPARLAAWFPARVEIDLALGGTMRFIFPNGEGPTLDGTIAELDPPHVLAYDWGDSFLRWESRPDGQGCVLVFTDAFDDRGSAAKFAAGWHVCLDALASALEGAPATPSHDRWIELHEGYVQSFG